MPMAGAGDAAQAATARATSDYEGAADGAATGRGCGKPWRLADETIGKP